jgi:ribonuclease HII
LRKSASNNGPEAGRRADTGTGFLSELVRLTALSAPDRALWANGFSAVAGVDEVGRGCLAGPVFAGAVILPAGFSHPGIDDSKKVPALLRDRLAHVIEREAVTWAVASATAREIDSSNIAAATFLAMRRALAALTTEPDIVLVDAFAIPGIRYRQVPLIHGDARSISIAAASIVAKVHRDRAMEELALSFPVYGFERHRGYGVEEHRAALAKFGPCPEHRLSFRGVVREREGELAWQ